MKLHVTAPLALSLLAGACDAPHDAPIPPVVEALTVHGAYMNGQTFDVAVAPGEDVEVVIDATIATPDCPSCIAQLVVGFDDEALGCVYDGIPGIDPGTHETMEITASRPGRTPC